MHIPSPKTDIFFSEFELRAVESEHAEGLTSHQIVELLWRRGARFSEATLRKYVQLGLLPRSRRVGLKGKHRGSQGLYPVATVRRIQVVRKLMSDGNTIEQVRELLGQRVDLEALRGELERVIGGVERRLTAGAGGSAERRRNTEREIAEARRSASDLVRRIERLDRTIRPAVKRPVVAVPPAPPRTPGRT